MSKSPLTGLALCALLSSLGISIANVGLPTLAVAFDVSFQQVQWVVLAYLLVVTSLIVNVGRLSDLTGRRRLMLAGVTVFTLASLLCGIAPTLEALIAARSLQGLGGAIMMVLTLVCVAETMPAAQVGRAMGVLGTMSAIGTALGPSVGGALIAAVGWRAMFLVIVPLGPVTFLLLQRGLPRDAREPTIGRTPFDYSGALLLALALVAFALAMTTGRGGGGINTSLLLAAAFSLGLFVVVEAKAVSPLIPLGTLREPVLGVGLALSAIVSTVIMATLVVGPFYLEQGAGLSPARVGLVMSGGPLMSALTGVPAGRLVDRFGASRMTIAGLLTMAIGATALSVWPTWLGVAGYVGALAVMTTGYALFQAANNTAVMIGVRAEQRGLVSGVLKLSRNLGLMTGASAMGAVFVFGTGSSDITHASADAVAGGLKFTFIVAAMLLVGALAIAVWSRLTSVRTTTSVQSFGINP